VINLLFAFICLANGKYKDFIENNTEKEIKAVQDVLAAIFIQFFSRKI